MAVTSRYEGQVSNHDGPSQRYVAVSFSFRETEVTVLMIEQVCTFKSGQMGEVSVKITPVSVWVHNYFMEGIHVPIDIFQDLEYVQKGLLDRLSKEDLEALQVEIDQRLEQS
jgi:hypothetical protein